MTFKFSSEGELIKALKYPIAGNFTPPFTDYIMRRSANLACSHYHPGQSCRKFVLGRLVRSLKVAGSLHLIATLIP